MPWTLYRSDDVGAPVLSGTAGSLIALLDAILVNGYGDKPAAGWEKTYSGTNLAAYRALTGNRHYLRVDDTSTATGRPAYIRAYETMSDVTTGENAFPTTGQLVNGLILWKSINLTSNYDPWYCLANDTTIYLFANNQVVSNPTISTDPLDRHQFLWFGELVPRLTGDAHTSFLVANTEAYNTTRLGAVGSAGCYVSRGLLGAPGALNAERSAWMWGNTTVFGAGAHQQSYPSIIDSTLDLSPVFLLETLYGNKMLRGALPAMFAPLHALPGSHLDLVDGEDGKRFMLISASDGSTPGRLALQVAGAVE